MDTLMGDHGHRGESGAEGAGPVEIAPPYGAVGSMHPAAAFAGQPHREEPQGKAGAPGEAASVSAGGGDKKPRRKYKMMRPREHWTAEEHEKFVRCVALVGRDWLTAADVLGTKAVVQVRSHAQKYFNKLRSAGLGHLIPPPIPNPKKRRSAAQELLQSGALDSKSELALPLYPDSENDPKEAEREDDGDSLSRSASEVEDAPQSAPSSEPKIAEKDAAVVVAGDGDDVLPPPPLDLVGRQYDDRVGRLGSGLMFLLPPLLEEQLEGQTPRQLQQLPLQDAEPQGERDEELGEPGEPLAGEGDDSYYSVQQVEGALDPEQLYAEPGSNGSNPLWGTEGLPLPLRNNDSGEAMDEGCGTRSTESGDAQRVVPSDDADMEMLMDTAAAMRNLMLNDYRVSPGEASYQTDTASAEPGFDPCTQEGATAARMSPLPPSMHSFFAPSSSAPSSPSCSSRNSVMKGFPEAAVAAVAAVAVAALSRNTDPTLLAAIMGNAGSSGGSSSHSAAAAAASAPVACELSDFPVKEEGLSAGMSSCEASPRRIHSRSPRYPYAAAAAPERQFPYMPSFSATSASSWSSMRPPHSRQAWQGQHTQQRQPQISPRSPQQRRYPTGSEGGEPPSPFWASPPMFSGRAALSSAAASDMISDASPFNSPRRRTCRDESVSDEKSLPHASPPSFVDPMEWDTIWRPTFERTYSDAVLNSMTHGCLLREGSDHFSALSPAPFSRSDMGY